jgi:hypothetical protein
MNPAVLFVLVSCQGGETASKSRSVDTGGQDSAPPAPDSLCSLGLEAEWIGGAADGSMEMGETPSMGDRLEATLQLSNPCGEELVLLGHPDLWMEGEGFSLAELPPISIGSGETAELSIEFLPGIEGSHTGRLSLPHSGPGSPLQADLSAVVTAPRILVLVGDGRRVATSEDYGESFVLDSFETEELQTDSLQRGLCWGGGRFISVGGQSARHFWSSRDGIDWTPGSEEGDPMVDCAYGDAGFVGLSQSPLFSIAGLQWVEGSPTPWMHDELSAIAYGDGVYIAAGDNGRIAVTSDGAEWSSDESVASFDLHSIAFGGGLFVAAGEFGGVVASGDAGETWETSVVGSGIIRSLLYAQEMFFAANGSEIYHSGDGLLWELAATTDIKPVAGIGQLLIGLKGAVLYRSLDRGVSWEELYALEPGIPIYAAELSGD